MVDIYSKKKRSEIMSAVKNKDSQLEKPIDQLVYKLYDLTPDEIAVVEGGEAT